MQYDQCKAAAKIYGWWIKIKQHDGQMFVLRALSENVFSPKGWQKTPRNCKNQGMFGSYRLHNGFTNLHCKADAKNTPDACKHVPDLF